MPFVVSWGATEDELSIQLLGDEQAPYISSTRAITIDAPRAEVWAWIVQLGADRSGFYSYAFIEKLLGYDGEGSINIIPEFQKMDTGRVVPSTKSGDKMNWVVTAVDTGYSFVLKNWGTFALREINPERTRLIVRTHGWETQSISLSIDYAIMIPTHYLMERRMMIGIRDRAEAGQGIHLSALPDYLWFFGIVLSYTGMVLTVFLFKGVRKILVPASISIVWMISLFVLDPYPVFAVALLISVSAILCLSFRANTQK